MRLSCGPDESGHYERVELNHYPTFGCDTAWYNAGVLSQRDLMTYRGNV
jgi:hypothetical protein